MPGRRGRGERKVQEALAALAGALDATGAPWMIIGGIAIIARGVRRLTTDIDVAVRGDAVDVGVLLETFARHGIVPRIAGAAAFARRNLVLLARHQETGVDLDVSLAWSGFELAALAARTKATYGRARLPTATAADLVVFKAIAGRPKDLDDAEALLLLHPEIDAAGARRQLAELAELAGAPELVGQFDAIVRRARPPKPRRR